MASTDMNHVALIGRATKDVELKYTQGGTAVASLSIANNKTWTQNGEKKEQVSFFNIVAWAKLGETIAQYVKKGDRIAIEGRLQQRSWEKDGQKHSVVEVIAENVQFLGVRQDWAKQEDAKQDDAPLMGAPVEDGSVKGFDQQAPSHFDDRDIPF